MGVITISGMLNLISTSNWSKSEAGLDTAHSDEEDSVEAAEDGRELFSELERKKDCIF